MAGGPVGPGAALVVLRYYIAQLNNLEYVFFKKAYVFMALEQNEALRQLNPFLELNINHVCRGSFDYHAINVFPVNILSVTLADDGGATYAENLDGGQTFPSRQGDVSLLPCGLRLRHEVWPGHRFISLHFNLTFLSGPDVFSGCKSGVARHDPELVARIDALFDEPDRLKAICELKAEVLRFCASCWPAGLGQLTPSVRRHEPIFRHVREHGNAALSVKALAAVAGQRQDVFSRAFSRDVGKSPKKFLQEELLKKITARLLAPETSVKQVAAELRFCSEFHLSHFFKRHVGLSPSAYQRQFRR